MDRLHPSTESCLDHSDEVFPFGLFSVCDEIEMEVFHFVEWATAGRPYEIIPSMGLEAVA